MQPAYRSSLVLFFCGFTLLVSLLQPYAGMAQTTAAADVIPFSEDQTDQSPSPAQLELLGYLPGPVFQVVANETLAVALTAGDLVVLDIRKPAQPRIMSRFSLSALPVGSTYGQTNLALVGDHLFVACPHHCGDAGLFVINLGVPTTPVIVGKLKGTADLRAIQIQGNLLYASLNADLAIIDIQAPTNPKVLAVQPLTGQFAHVSDLEVLTTANGVTYAFVVALNGKLYVFDVTTPTAPEQVAIFAPDRACMNDLALVTQGNQPRLYLTDCYVGVRVLDVTFPRQLREVATYGFGTDHEAYAIRAVGQQLLVATEIGSTSAWDSTLHLLASVDDALTETGSFQAFTYAYNMASLGQLLLLADAQYGLQFLDLADPVAIHEIGRQPVINAHHDLASDGRYLYLVDDGGLNVFDPLNPVAPVTIAQASTPYALTLVVQNGFALVTDALGGLHLFDLQQPTQPKLVSQSKMPILLSTETVISGTLGAQATAFVSGIGCTPFDCQPSLLSVALSEQQEPAIAILLPDGRGIGEMVQVGNFLYLTTGSPSFLMPSDLLILDITHPNNYTEVGKIAMPAAAASMATVGNALYVALSNALQTYDIANPAAPRLVYTLPLTRGFTSITVSNGWLYGKDGFTLTVVALAEPLQPTINRRYALPTEGAGLTTANSLLADYGTLYVLNNGLTIWRHQLDLRGRVLDVWGEPQAGAMIYLASSDAAQGSAVTPLTFSGLSGSYGLPSAMTGPYTIQAALEGYSIWPPTHHGVARDAAPAQNFYLLTKPVSVTVQPDAPATLAYRDSRGLQTSATIATGTVSQTSAIQLTPIIAFDQEEARFTGNAFALTVTDVDSGEQMPALTKPITVIIQYSTQGANAILSTRSLQLMQAIDGEWQVIPEKVASRQGRDNRTHNIFTIALDEPGCYALFGRTNTFYLPLVAQAQ